MGKSSTEVEATSPAKAERLIRPASQQELDDYRVGYKKPPKEHQFKTGQSGNRRGRTPRSNAIDSLFEAELNAKIRVKSADGTIKSMTKRQAIVNRVIEGALRGNVRQLEFLVRYLQSRGDPDPLRIKTSDEAELRRMLKSLPPSEDE